jgi:hypothetical protein
MSPIREAAVDTIGRSTNRIQFLLDPSQVECAAISLPSLTHFLPRPAEARSRKWGNFNCHFGGPADSGSPVALRHSLAGDLPLSNAVSNEYGCPSSPCQSDDADWESPNQTATDSPPDDHAEPGVGESRTYVAGSSRGSRPCTVFSQKEGVTTNCQAAFTAAIDIMIQ